MMLGMGMYGRAMNGISDDLFRVKKGKQLQYSKPRSETIKDDLRRREQGRNELCNCGSGKKFKKCCGRVINDELIKED